MTRSEREQQILRYLGGEMHSAEEQNFFIQVALDRELRDELKAQRAIEGSIRSFRDVERGVQHTRLRARTAAMLSGYPSPPSAAATAAIETTEGGAPGSPLLVKRIITALLTAGLCVGLYFIFVHPAGSGVEPIHTAGSQPAEQSLGPAPGEQHSRPAQLPGQTPIGRQGPATGADLQTPAKASPQPAVTDGGARGALHTMQGEDARHQNRTMVKEHSGETLQDGSGGPMKASGGKGVRTKDSMNVGVAVEIEMQK